MFRYSLLIFCFAVAASVAAQDDPPSTNYMYVDNVIPIARFGWGEPNAAAYMPDGETFAIATGAGVTFYDQTLSEVQHVPTWAHAPRTIAITPDGKILATGGDDVRLWDIETGALLDILQSGVDVSSLDFSPDGTLLAVSHGVLSHGELTGTIIFETATGRERQRFLPNQPFTRIRFDPSGMLVIATQSTISCCTSVIIELATGGLRQDIYIPSLEFAQFSSDGETIVGFDGTWNRYLDC